MTRPGSAASRRPIRCRPPPRHLPLASSSRRGKSQSAWKGIRQIVQSSRYSQRCSKVFKRRILMINDFPSDLFSDPCCSMPDCCRSETAAPAGTGTGGRSGRRESGGDGSMGTRDRPTRVVSSSSSSFSSCGHRTEGKEIERLSSSSGGNTTIAPPPPPPSSSSEAHVRINSANIASVGGATLIFLFPMMRRRLRQGSIFTRSIIHTSDGRMRLLN